MDIQTQQDEENKIETEQNKKNEEISCNENNMYFVCMCFIVLYRTVLYCIVLCCVRLYCTLKDMHNIKIHRERFHLNCKM